MADPQDFLSREILDYLDDLVRQGRYPNREAALKELLGQLVEKARTAEKSGEVFVPKDNLGTPPKGGSGGTVIIQLDVPTVGTGLD